MSLTIGVLLDADLDYGVGVLEGVREFARTQAGWRVVPITAAQEGLLARLAHADGLQGVIGSFLSDRWLVGRFPDALPLVNTSNLSQIDSICSVVPDDVAVGRLVARHFCDLGHSHLAVLADRAATASQLRRDGFVAYLSAASPPGDSGMAPLLNPQSAVNSRRPAVSNQHPETSTPKPGTRNQKPGTRNLEPQTRNPKPEILSPSPVDFRLESAWRAWLETLSHPTAVFCTSDRLACRFWEVCRACEPTVQARVVALAGAGDSLTARVVSGLDLTSVPLPARTVGFKAAARLARLLDGERIVICERVAPLDLVVRGSTAHYASPDPVVAHAMGVAMQTLARPPGVAEIARRAGVSRRTLEQRFRVVLGCSPAAEFRARRLELARRLLEETGLTVAEIATRVGAGSVQGFTTLFRQATGLPPARYRARHSRDG